MISTDLSSPKNRVLVCIIRVVFRRNFQYRWNSLIIIIYKMTDHLSYLKNRLQIIILLEILFERNSFKPSFIASSLLQTSIDSVLFSGARVLALRHEFPVYDSFLFGIICRSIFNQTQGGHPCHATGPFLQNPIIKSMIIFIPKSSITIQFYYQSL